MFVCTHMFVCVYTCAPEVNVRFLSYFFETGILIGLVRIAGQEGPGSLLSPPPQH